MLREGERYFENGRPQCSQKCIVGARETYGIGGTICICELVAGHPGPHERIGTMRMATASDTRNYPAFADFVIGKALNEAR